MNWTRRVFVRETFKGWLGLVVAPAVYSAFRLLTRPKSSGVLQTTDVGSSESLAAGVAKSLTISGQRILVVRSLDNQLHGVSAVCTHLGCSIRLDASKGIGELVCNCHESRFSLSGENLGGPATRPLTEYDLSERKGRLIVAEKASGGGS